MSAYKEASIENMDVDGDEIDIYVGSDEHGNNYVTVKIADVLRLLADSELRGDK